MFKQIEDVIKHPSERELAYQEHEARLAKASANGERKAFGRRHVAKEFARICQTGAR